MPAPHSTACKHSGAAKGATLRLGARTSVGTSDPGAPPPWAAASFPSWSTTTSHLCTCRRPPPRRARWPARTRASGRSWCCPAPARTAPWPPRPTAQCTRAHTPPLKPLPEGPAMLLGHGRRSLQACPITPRTSARPAHLSEVVLVQDVALVLPRLALVHHQDGAHQLHPRTHPSHSARRRDKTAPTFPRRRLKHAPSPRERPCANAPCRPAPSAAAP